MDRSQHTFSSLDELRQIQSEARQAQNESDLRYLFERVQALRRTYADDFDLQVLATEVHEQIISRARSLRDGQTETSPEPTVSPKAHEEDRSAAAEIPPNVPRLDTKNWQRVIYLSLFLTVLVCAAFFYLIQAARRINIPQTDNSSQVNQPQANKPGMENASTAQAPAPAKPTVRLYTDLIPGTVSVDDAAPEELKDGELVLDNLPPGQHSMKVVGRSGNAAFTFDIGEKSAPRIIGLPVASNAMTVLVSEQDGKAQLVTNADQSEVLLDGKAAGQVGTGGLSLDNLGTVDHNLQVTQNRDRQQFVLTYTPAPALTVYVKSDPNAGTMVVVTGQDGVDVYINDMLYRRKTDRGQLRIPLRVGEYTIRVHKAGFIDPPPQSVNVKKAEEAAVEFRMQPVPEIATLQIKGALPGTIVYVDKDVAASIGPDGNASISNVKPGQHTVELRRDQALPKRFERVFKTGETIVLSGPDVTLEKVVSDNKPAPPPSAPNPGDAKATAQNLGMEIQGEQVRKGGGFVPYHVPKAPGRYFFQAQGRIGGILKHGKLSWYAGYQDSDNYIMFTLDGKHATIREVHDGKATETSRVPFNADSNEWVQVDLSVKPNAISAQVKTPDRPWTEIGTATSPGRDFTQGKVGFYIPGNDEIAVSNFRFTNH